MPDNPTLIDLDCFTHNLKARSRERVKLSPRERQVMQLIAEGKTLEAIAHSRHITISVVRLYVASVHRKLQAPSTPCAIARCVELRLIKPTMG